MTAGDIFGMVARRKLVVLLFFLAALGGGYAGLKLMGPTYSASVELLVKVGQEDLFVPTLPSTSSEVRSPLALGNQEQQVNSEVQILQSETLARRVLEHFGATGLFPGIDERHPWYTPKGLVQRGVDGLHWLEGYLFPSSANMTLDERALRRFRRSIAAVPAKDSTVIDVSVRSMVPEVASEAVNDLVRRYLEEREHLYSRESEAFFQDQLDKLEAQSREANDRLVAFQHEHGTVDADQQRGASLSRLAEVRTNLQNEQVAADQVTRRIAVLWTQLAQELPSERLTTNSVYSRIKDDLLKAEADLAPHEQSMRNWARIAAELTAHVDTLNDSQGEGDRLRQTLRTIEDSRRLYLQKLEEARVQGALAQSRFGNVTVVSWASPDRALFSPPLQMVLGGVVAAGLLGGIGLAILLGLMDDRIRTDKDATAATGLPVLAEVGNMSFR